MPDIDILSLIEARRALNIRDADNDAERDQELAAVITAASQFVDKEVGPVVIRAITDERHDGGVSFVQLKRYPVAAVTAISEYAAGTATALTAESETAAGTYRIDFDTGTIHRRASWSRATFGTQSVVVTYTAGRFANTAAVDASYKEAAVIALHHFWQVRGAGNGPIGTEESVAYGAAPYSTTQLAKQVRAKVFSHDPVVA